MRLPARLDLHLRQDNFSGIQSSAVAQRLTPNASVASNHQLTLYCFVLPHKNLISHLSFKHLSARVLRGAVGESDQANGTRKDKFDQCVEAQCRSPSRA